MTDITQSKKPPPTKVGPGQWRISAALLTAIVTLPSLAFAHGGMGPNELGPPIMTAGAIGFASYWLVMFFWPSAREEEDTVVGPHGRNASPSSHKHPHKRSARGKRSPRLRRIEGTGHFDGDHQHIRRKASDG